MGDTYHGSHPIQSAREALPYLCSLHLEDYSTLTERAAFVRKLKGHSIDQFTTRDVARKHRKWAALALSEFHGGKWFLNPDATAFLASYHIIPLKWIMDWFREDLMARRKAEWAQARYYKQAPMPNSFMIIYERNSKGIQIQQPLNPHVPVNRDIIRQREGLQADGTP